MSEKLDQYTSIFKTGEDVVAVSHFTWHAVQSISDFCSDWELLLVLKTVWQYIVRHVVQYTAHGPVDSCIFWESQTGSSDFMMHTTIIWRYGNGTLRETRRIS